MTQTGNPGWLVRKRRGSFEDLTELSGGSGQVGHCASYVTIIRSANTHTHTRHLSNCLASLTFFPAVRSLLLPQRCDTPLFLILSSPPHYCTRVHVHTHAHKHTHAHPYGSGLLAANGACSLCWLMRHILFTSQQSDRV